VNEKESKAKILIVDDKPANIKILGEALRNEYDICITTNGKRALEIAFSDDMPDLILLDIVMPEFDGYMVCKALKENHKTKDIPIIFITIKNEVDDEAIGFELGGVDYITKPFSLPIVKARVKTHLDLKRKRDKLENMAKKLEQLNIVKNRFLGTAAHDLRNPLGSIQNIAEVLLMELENQLTDDQMELIQMIFTQSEHMLLLINDLLDVAVIESGHLTMNFEKDSLSLFIAQRIRLMKSLASKKGQHIISDIQNSKDALFDKDRIGQVFDNLFSNAIKFSPINSTIQIRVYEKESYVMVDIQDEGPGLSKTDQSKLFNEFQRLSSKPTGNEKSTGLGLSIVKAIIDAHHGKIIVKSEPGIGTTMTIALPMSNEE